MSISMNYLLDKVGVAWTFRIVGIITLCATLPASLLLKERSRRGTATIEWLVQLSSCEAHLMEPFVQVVFPRSQVCAALPRWRYRNVSHIGSCFLYSSIRNFNRNIDHHSCLHPRCLQSCLVLWTCSIRRIV